MTFIEKLEAAWDSNNSLVCVGLDPDIARIPDHLLVSAKSNSEAIVAFNKAIIDATADIVCAYKPQLAHFSALEAEDALLETVRYIHAKYPNIPVILDGKRGDIGSTAERYAHELFVRYGADAVTINPYLGFDSVKPFTDHSEKGVVILCRTSNAGAADIQDLEVDGVPVYQKVAELVRDKWNYNQNCMVVVGATWPKQMSSVRSILPQVPFLVPGVGAQGGNVEQIVKQGQTAQGKGLVISSSRAVLYASGGEDFADAARTVVMNLNDEINTFR